MRSKRLLTLLLAVCLVMSCVMPAAATTVGSETASSVGASQKAETAKTESASKHENDRLISPVSGNHIQTLRDNKDHVIISGTTKTESVASGWTIAPSDTEITASIHNTEIPQSVLDLKEMEEEIAENEVVRAFVVMEEAPLIQTYSSFTDIPEDVQELMELLQETIIEAIEEQVLDGEMLDVRRQFTWLTNAFSISTEFGNLEEIAYIDGVKSVFVMPTYDVCEDQLQSVAVPYTTSATEMTGVNAAWDLGFTGSGMTIAIIDSGLDLDHPSFAADPADPSLTVAKIDAVLEDLNAYAYAESNNIALTAEALYRSAKIPFAFCYVDADLDATHDKDNQGYHGTHVAGIAAANKVEGTSVVGMAPDAQLVIMKVFGNNGGAYMDDIAAALEDAAKLGCDVANLSLGSPAGFSQSGYDFIDEIYENLGYTDMIINISAGNEGTSSYGNLWGTNLNTTANMDNGTLGSPSSYANANSIASVDNNMLSATAIALNGEYYMYNDGLGLAEMRTIALDENGDVKTYEYVMVPNLGEAADFEGLDVAGKIAVIARGTINFSVKLANAEAAGAVGVIITNNVDGSVSSFGMSFEDDNGNLAEGVSGDVPAILVSLKTGEALAASETKTLTIAPENVVVKDEGGGQVSSFSSWGVTPDLRLLPDMAGIGGNVYSTYDKGQYGYMSGTSMSSPQVAGMSALVVEYLKEELGVAEENIRETVDALLMSTAEPVISTDTGLEASPRQQGAGLVNALNALTSGAYVTVDATENNKPKAELGDNASGVFTFTFTVHNFSEEAKTYNLSSSGLLTEAVDPDYLPYGLYFMAGYETELDGTVSFSADSVTVAAGGTADITVTVTVSDAGKAWLNQYYPNGGFVEGYVYLTNADESGVDLSLPFLGFCGDWTDAPVFDTAYWYDNSFWDATNAGIDGNEFWHVMWTDLEGTDWVLGFNPYSGAYEDEAGNIVYDPANNVISNNGDGVLDEIANMYVSLMRNAKTLTFTYTDEEGNVLFEEVMGNVSKTMYISAYGQVVPYVHSWYTDGNYDFTDADGNPLPSGTKVTLTISGVLDYEGAAAESIQIPITLDTNAPVVDPKSLETEVTEDGNVYVTFTAADETSLAAVYLMNPAGTQIYGAGYDPAKNEDGTYTLTMNITGLGTEFLLVLADYGCNEAYYDLSFKGEFPDGNKPEVDTDALYAYRVYDAAISDDSLYGWITIDKETAETTQLTNDQREYYALTAAEYAGGYVFAVDAGHNFLVMDPGLWNRTTICNLGTGVLDMTFSKEDQTMYVTTKGDDEYGDTVYGFGTLDLLTGELELIAESSSAYSMPYAMAATDDGTIYAVKYYDSGLYTVDTETGTLSAVTDADDNAISLTRQGGNVVYPYYNQSMTYSSEDKVIYWSFFTYSYDAELFTIDVSEEVPTWSSVEFPVDAECVGVLTLDDDGYVLPEAEALSQLVLSSDSLLMIEGESAYISVSALPWTYTPSEDVVWTSSDEDVATVSADGTVTAVAEGYATITATCEGVSAECEVTVVHVEGTIYAYDYYNGTGDYEDWISIDLGSMTAESLGASPVDFLAADYNGHDGYIYGYDLNGQFYRYNPETGDYSALGTPVANVPTDMAYDYSTGFMYAMIMDQNNWISTLCYVNMRTGALVEVATAYDIFMTLACDDMGNLFAISYDGVLYYLMLTDAEGGIGGIEPLSDEDGTASTLMIEPQYIMEGFGTLYYAQSMCWDYTNGVLIWAYPEASVMLWIDIYGDYVLNLGDPTGSGLFQFTGLYTIPEVIEELPYVPVQSVSADDMLLMVGGSKLAGINVNPLNATNQDVIWTSADEAIATVDENGLVTGVSQGVTIITGTLVDGEDSFDVSFNVNVKMSGDNIFGYVANDLASGGGNVWASIPDTDPTNGIEYLSATDYMIYAEEYYNGKLYAYGYDDYDWEANFQFMVIDPTTFLIESMTDMGETFPFVYDMTFDYTTGTMYAVAGYNSSSSDLYMVDLNTGRLVSCMNTEPFFMSIAAGSDGTLYGMTSSESYFDEETWTDVYSNAKIYTFDVAAGTYTELFDTGVKSNKLASMAFDHDTGNLYWTALFQASYWDPAYGGLYLIDLEEQQCYNLGNIGAAGSLVTGLYVAADEVPEIPDYLVNIFLTSTVEQMGVGETLPLDTFVQPFGYPVNPVWSTSDESVATVDEDGVVTAVGSGVATVTVTVVDGENTFTSSCAIIAFGEDDYFLTYDRTQNAFAMISRMDTSNVTILESAAQEEQADIRAMAMADGVLYGYDMNNGFFTTDTANNRTYLGEAAGIDLPEDNDSYDYYYEVRDMAWDSGNNRMLAVICKSVLDLDNGWFYELSDGCLLCQVDLSTGALTELATFCTSSGDSISNVYTLTVTDDGVVYGYSSARDYVFTVDVETGVVTYLTTLQNQGVYGDSDGNPMAMEYDPITCNISMLFTQNGRAYRMVCFNTTDKSMNVMDYIGAFDEDYYETNLYAGLVINAEHVHAWTPTNVITEPTCTEEGLGEHDCLICGVHEEVVLDALGHDWHVTVILKKDKCTDLGHTVSVCKRCGKVEHNWDMPHAHKYETTTDLKGNTVHTCIDCGFSYTERKVNHWWDKLFPWLGGWWE